MRNGSISPNTCQDVGVVAGVDGRSAAGPDNRSTMQARWNVSDGNHALDLDGRNAILSRTFATVPGKPTWSCLICPAILDHRL